MPLIDKSTLFIDRFHALVPDIYNGGDEKHPWEEG